MEKCIHMYRHICVRKTYIICGAFVNAFAKACACNSRFAESSNIPSLHREFFCDRFSHGMAAGWLSFQCASIPHLATFERRKLAADHSAWTRICGAWNWKFPGFADDLFFFIGRSTNLKRPFVGNMFWAKERGHLFKNWRENPQESSPVVGEFKHLHWLISDIPWYTISIH